jgi:hypothetical protein
MHTDTHPATLCCTIMIAVNMSPVSMEQLSDVAAVVESEWAGTVDSHGPSARDYQSLLRLVEDVHRWGAQLHCISDHAT